MKSVFTNQWRTLLLITFSVCAFMMTSAQEQQTALEGGLKPKFGIKGGLNLSNLYVDDVQDENMKAGFNLGVFSKLPLAKGFSIQPELIYSNKGAKISYNNALLGNGEYRFNLHYVELPVLAVINLVKNLNLQAGGYASYLAAANITRLNNSSGTVDQIRDLKASNFNRFDYGLVGGLGIDVENFTIGARYNYGLEQIGKGNASIAGQATKNSKNSVIALYVGIGF